MISAVNKKYSLYISLLNVLELLGNVLEGIFFNLCRRKPLDITKGIIPSVLSLLLQSVFVHVCERKRERKGWADKQNKWYKIYRRKGSTLFLSFPSCCLWGAGEMEAGNRLLQFHLRVARLACQVIITMTNAGRNQTDRVRSVHFKEAGTQVGTDCPAIRFMIGFPAAITLCKRPINPTIPHLICVI